MFVRTFARSYNTQLYISTLQNDMKLAMKQKDAIRKDTIKFIVASLKAQMIDSKGKTFDEYSVDDVYSKLIKEHKNSIAYYTANGRNELVNKEQTELSILEEYRKQLCLCSDEVKQNVKQLVCRLQTEQPSINIGDIFKQVNLKQLSEQWGAPAKSIRKAIVEQVQENKTTTTTPQAQ